MKADFIIERQGKQMVLYEGLLDEFHRRNDAFLTEHPEFLGQVEYGVRAWTTQEPTEQNGMTAKSKARVTMAWGAVFEEEADADTKNTNRMVHAHIRRMATTRAKARALRDAVNIGIAAVEEASEDDETPATTTARREPQKPEPIRTPSPAARAVEQRSRERLAERGEPSSAKPATANQMATIAKLQRFLNVPDTITEDMTSADAADRITDLSQRYQEAQREARSKAGARQSTVKAVQDNERRAGREAPTPPPMTEDQWGTIETLCEGLGKDSAQYEGISYSEASEVIDDLGDNYVSVNDGQPKA